MGVDRYHERNSQGITFEGTVKFLRYLTSMFSYLKCNVTNLESRRKILEEKGRCFLCLRSQHLCRNCLSGMHCFKCNGSHHTSICDAESASAAYKGKVSTGSQSDESSVTHTSSTGTLVNIGYSQSKGATLLHTAQACVVQPDEEIPSHQVRLVFDSGSQRSYITENLCDALKLPVVGKDSLLIKAFDHSDARLRVCNMVQVGIRTLDGMVVYIQAYAVPVICGPITNQPTKIAQDLFPHLHGLQMADASYGSDPLTVNMLPVADCYWTLVEGDMIKGGPSEPVAMATKLGYVLSGPVCGAVSDLSDFNTSLIATHVLKIATDDCSDTDLSADLRKF